MLPEIRPSAQRLLAANKTQRTNWVSVRRHRRSRFGTRLGRYVMDRLAPGQRCHMGLR